MKLVKVTIPACLGGRKLAVFAALATLVCAADTITVAQGETQNITAAATVTAMEVHGTLNLQGTASAAAELTFDPKETKAYLGSAAGDNAVINIGDYGRIKAGRFMVGGPGGVELLRRGQMGGGTLSDGLEELQDLFDVFGVDVAHLLPLGYGETDVLKQYQRAKRLRQLLHV